MLWLFIAFAVIVLCIIIYSVTIKPFIETKRFQWLKGRTVVITGASSGIGMAVAHQCALYGAKLIISARRRDRLDSVANECRCLGSPEVQIQVCDVTDKNDCLSLVDSIENPVDLFVMNAGVGMDFSFDETTPELAHKIMNSNFWGPFWLLHHALEVGLFSSSSQEEPGRVVIVSSTSSYLPRKNRAMYSASKAAVSELFANIRTEINGIASVTVISPGFVKNTELSDGVSRLHAKQAPNEESTTKKPSKSGWRKWLPEVTADSCAKRLLLSAINREYEVSIPQWYTVIGLLRIIFPGLYFSIVG